VRGGRSIGVVRALASTAAVVCLFGMFAPSTAVAAVSSQALGTYADCMARRHYRELAEALDSGFDQTFATALAAVPSDGCDTGGVSDATPAELRGPLFAALYRRFAPGPGRSASNILSEAGWVPTLPEGDTRIGWYAVSNCLAMRPSGAARDLVKATPGGDRAARHMQEIVEELPRCLPAGQEFKVSAVVLAGLIAETVYQIDFATLYGDKKCFWSGC
jgi:hypothetical protein